MRSLLFQLCFFLIAIGRALAVPEYDVLAEMSRAGTNPLGRLVQAADGNFYGTTSAGGVNDLGTVVRVGADGEVATVLSFSGTSGPVPGATPACGLTIGPDGALYGATTSGGAGDYGTIFKVTTGGAFTSLVAFTGTSGAAPGSAPGELLLHGGVFYGVAEGGGTNNQGTVFSMTTTGVVNTLVHFTGVAGAKKGSAPVGPLALAGADLFGLTSAGGTGDRGTIFKVTTSGTFTALGDFTGTTGVRRGEGPAAGLVLHSDGLLYGTTEFGGADDLGVVFKITTAGAFTLIYQFDDTNGAQPAGRLCAAADGKLYGTTAFGGAEGYGTIYHISSGATHGVLHSFLENDGTTPRSGLIQIPTGELWGTASAGSAGDYGAFYQITPGGAFTKMSTLTLATGWRPVGSVASGHYDDQYFVFAEGGSGGGGGLARISSTGGVLLQGTFSEWLGTEPSGAITRLGNSIYGTTNSGGANSLGTFYSAEAGEEAVQLASLDASGGTPVDGALAVGPDGNLYGVAQSGGATNRGTVFRFTTSGVRTRLASFTGTTGAVKGMKPRGPLALAGDGNFYGVTERGGLADSGTIFRITPAGALTTLIEFTATGPRLPLAGLVLGRDGHLYGTLSQGGANGHGTVFQITTAGALTTLVDFTGTSGTAPGSEPAAQLMVAHDGTLYGSTNKGGTNDLGTLFRRFPNGTFETLFHLSGTIGSTPGEEISGALNFGENGYLHGTTSSGGEGGGGVIFRIKKIGPHVATDLAVDIHSRTVRLQATTSTGAENGQFFFDYGTTSALGQTSPGVNYFGNTHLASGSHLLTGLTPGQTLYYRARAVGPSGTTTGEIRSITLPNPFADWATVHFGNPAAPLLSDPDFDGLPNLTEYALGFAPTAVDTAGLPQPTCVNYPDGQRLTITVPRDPIKDDLIILVQAAPALAGPWQTIATSSFGNPFNGLGYVSGDNTLPGAKQVIIRDIVSVSPAVTGRYMRVKITR